MAMNFPDAPTIGQTFTVGSKTWTWGGSTWDLQVGVTTLADVAVTPGSYTAANITVDQKGRVVAASSSNAASTGKAIAMAIVFGG